MKKALVIVTAVFLFCSTLMAQDTETTRFTLKGLTGVEVVVDYSIPDADKDRLSRDQIQTDVELRLRTAGIKVLTHEQMFLSPGMPTLGVMLSTVKNLETYSFFLVSA